MLEGLTGRFKHDHRGSVAVKFAVVLPALFAIIGVAIDQSRYFRDLSALQYAADAAALAATKELSLADRKYEDLAGIVQSMAQSHADQANLSDLKTTTTITTDPVEVEVSVVASFNSMFRGITLVDVTALRASSVARVSGKPNICVLGLNQVEGGTISLEHQARVTGNGCAVFSNSEHTRGLKAKNDASLTASTICSRGGKDGGPGNFNPSPLVDCPSFEDPLLSRSEPDPGSCDNSLPVVVTGAMKLDPGTYCGLELRSGADVTLGDGVYVFKDKPLLVRDGAALSGEAAGLFFVGAAANFVFEADSTISLSAPKTGPMSGLLIFTSRTQSDKLQYKILSNDARVMVGTLYVPKGELMIDATSPIADQSAYTAIVADKMRLYGGPHLVLNTNYSDTNVPVPDGIAGAGQPAVLVK